MNKIIKIGLDAHLLNYVDNETPRFYFVDGGAELEDVIEFAKLFLEECETVLSYKDYVKLKEHFGL